MMTRPLWCFTLVTIFALGARAVAGQDEAKDKAAIKENAKAFIEAFQKGDAKALADFFTPEGECTDETGRELKGRAAIQKAFEELFSQNKDLKLRIDSHSLRFLTPEVAVEDGTTAVIAPDGGPPSRARYTNVHVKKDSRWLIGSSKLAVSAPVNNSEHLHELEWLLGEWSDESEKGEVARVSLDWAENQTFIVATFGSTFKNMSVGGGTQWIGWDPVEKHIRSWTFDANGGYGDGVWAKDRDKWTIKVQSVLPDGKKASATNIVTRIDADTLSWQSTERKVDGNSLPDIKEIKFKRAK